jgi:hypothetical protein
MSDDDKCCESAMCERDAEHCFSNAYGDSVCVCSPCGQRYFTTEYLAKVNGPREEAYWVYTNAPEFEEIESIAEAEYEARQDYLRDMDVAS